MNGHRGWKSLVEAWAAGVGMVVFAGLVFILFGLAASRVYEFVAR